MVDSTIQTGTPTKAQEMSANLNRLWGETWVKLLVVAVAIAIIVLFSVGLSRLRSGPEGKVAPVSVGSFAVPSDAPKGELDIKAIGDSVRVDADAAAAAEKSGGSYLGDFRYSRQDAAARAGKTAGKIDDLPAGSDPTLSDVRSELAKIDQASAKAQRSADVAANRPTSPDQTAIAPSSQYSPYTSEQIAALQKQLDKTVAVMPLRYVSAEVIEPKELAKTNAVAVADRGAGLQPSVATANDFEFVAGGEVCPVTLDNPINTDLPGSVFVTIQGCGELYGVKLKGAISRSPDDFTVVFDTALLPRGYKYRITSPVQAESVNLNSGSTGVAQDVNRHWFARLGAAGLLGLVTAERAALAARSQQSFTSPTGSVQTVDKYSPSERRDARTAGAAEGALNVITRDVSTGINRQPTMTTPADIALGVRFIQPVRGVKL